MPATARPVPVGQLQLLVPLPPLTVDGIPGQLDLVAAINEAEADVLPAGVTVTPLFPGCDTTRRVVRDWMPLADLTSTEGFTGSVLAKFDGIRGFYRFPDQATAVAAAISAADRGYWYGEV